MSIDTFTNCDLWDLKKPLIPSRSRLHHLEPVGIGTPYVESLTGYIARLAESHCLLPGVLISSKIALSVERVFVKRSTSRGLRALFDRATALNGTGSMATDLVQALETLTLCSNLRFLTMLSWAEIIPPRGLFRAYRTWCPACYKEWRLSRQVVYEPLLWTINAVSWCSQHHQPLLSQCHNCHQKLPLLTWRSRPGYCSNCGAWLGISLSTNSSAELFDGKILSPDELKWQAWVVDAIGGLIAAAPHLSSPLPKESITKSFRAAVDLVAEGNIAEFARKLKMPKNTVWMWHTGSVLPQLDALLQICHYLETSLLDFLKQQSIPTKPREITTHKSLTPYHQQRAISKQFDLNKVREALLASLVSNEEPPSTMEEVAKRLGYQRRTICKHFPELCRTISAKSRSYKQAVHLKKLEFSCSEVRQIAIELHNKGIHPSEARVSELITRPGDLRNKQVRVALKEVQSKLGK